MSEINTNNLRYEQPYDSQKVPLSFYTNVNSVYVDKDTSLIQWINKKLKGISGGSGEGSEGGGNALEGIEVHYTCVTQDENSEEVVKTLSESRWQTNSPTLTNEYPYLWKRTRIIGTDSEGLQVYLSVTYEFCGCVSDPGIDAEWKEWIWKITPSEKTSGKTLEEIKGELEKGLSACYSSDLNSDYQQNDYVPKSLGWSDDMLTTDEDNSIQWCASRYKKNKIWSPFGNVHVFGRKAENGTYIDNIYTITEEIDSDKWDNDDEDNLGDRQILINNLVLDVNSGTVSGLTKESTHYKWYDSVPNTEASEIIYQASAYFVGSSCINIDDPIRISGPAGVGTDGNGVEFAYCAWDGSDPEDIPELIGTPEPLDGVSNGWYDTASMCPISPTLPYQFVCQRQGQYTSEDNWYWMYQGTKYGKGDNVTDSSKAPEGWNYGWGDPVLWSSWGVDGVDGDGIQYVFLQLTQNEHDFVEEDSTRWNFDGTASTVIKTEQVNNISNYTSEEDINNGDSQTFTVNGSQDKLIGSLCYYDSIGNTVYIGDSQAYLSYESTKLGGESNTLASEVQPIIKFLYESNYITFKYSLSQGNLQLKVSIQTSSSQDFGEGILDEEYPISIFHYDSGDVNKQWTDNPQGVSANFPYEYCCTRKYTNLNSNSKIKGWESWNPSNISLWSHYGMNASPYQLLLGNPYESLYYIQDAGIQNNNYIILDEQGITTGDIIFQGGYENSDATYNLAINPDKLCILTDNGNTENFFSQGVLNLDLGDGWNCKFKLSTSVGGNPVITISGIGDSPDTEVSAPDNIKLSEGDDCFIGTLQAYQKKIVIKATNDDKNISALTTWVVSAIHDKNGDGIWRYRIMPNIDRVVYSVYYKKVGTSDSDVQKISWSWNIGTAQSLKFDLEKDTYGTTWKNISNQNYRICFIDPEGQKISYAIEGTSGPAEAEFTKITNMMNEDVIGTALQPAIKQYQILLQVQDPDYSIDTSYGEGKWSTVDKCNLIFEYIVSFGGKDGENGENGSATMFNLSNDSGSFAYNYNTNPPTININENDCSTDIQYSKDSNFVVCDSLEINGESITSSGPKTISGADCVITKGSSYWSLKITNISYSGSYESVYSFYIKGKVDNKEVGSATFKMIGTKDLDENGVYAYRLIADQAYTGLNASASDYLKGKIYRDALILGSGYSSKIPIVIKATYKNQEEAKNDSKYIKVGGGVTCESPVSFNTEISLSSIQSNNGIILQVYAKDDDYKNREALPSDSGIEDYGNYYYTGESEDIAYTASGAEIDSDTILSELKIVSCNNDNIVVGENNTYELKFTTISGAGINVQTFTPDGNFYNIFEETPTYSGNNGIYKLQVKDAIDVNSVSGTLACNFGDGYNTVYINYIWVGDINNDGVYYDYSLEASSQVLGYSTASDGVSISLSPKSITLKGVTEKHEGKIKKSSAGKGYVFVENNDENFGKLDSNGEVTLNLNGTTTPYYSGTTSFKVYWYVDDDDYAGVSGIPIKYLHTNNTFSSEQTSEADTAYYQVDYETIDVVSNDAISISAQGYQGFGEFIIDPTANGGPTATFKYTSTAPGYYKVTFNNALYNSTGDIIFTSNNKINASETVSIIMGPSLMRNGEDSVDPTSSDLSLKESTSDNIAWIKCNTVNIQIYSENTYSTKLFEDTITRTGTDGYYWNVDDSGLVSIQSNGDSMTSISQTASSLVSIASGVSVNMCKGAATNDLTKFNPTSYPNIATFDTPIVSESVNADYNGITVANAYCTVTSKTVSGSTTYTRTYSNIQATENTFLKDTSDTTSTSISCLCIPVISTTNTPSKSEFELITESAGISFTSNMEKDEDYLLSFYAKGSGKLKVTIGDNANTYTPNSSEYTRYTCKISSIGGETIKFTNASSNIVYLSSIQLEKGTLLTDWKDYGKDVSSIIQDASSVTTAVSNLESKTKNMVKVDENGVLLCSDQGGLSSSFTLTKNGGIFSGNVAATSFQVNKTTDVTDSNFDFNQGMMWFTTKGKAITALTTYLEYTPSINGLGSGTSDDTPIILIKQDATHFFVLNPLLLYNNSSGAPVESVQMLANLGSFTASIWATSQLPSNQLITIYTYNTSEGIKYSKSGAGFENDISSSITGYLFTYGYCYSMFDRGNNTFAENKIAATYNGGTITANTYAYARYEIIEKRTYTADSYKSVYYGFVIIPRMTYDADSYNSIETIEIITEDASSHIGLFNQVLTNTKAIVLAESNTFYTEDESISIPDLSNVKITDYNEASLLSDIINNSEELNEENLILLKDSKQPDDYTSAILLELPN